MSKLNLKLKSGLKDKIEKEKEQKESGGRDMRMLNYFDLKTDQKMTVLIVPDVNGELWTKFKKHGPNLKNRKIDDIGCAYAQNGDDCPACQKGFDFLNLSKEAGSKAEADALKDEAKRWFGKDYTVASCIVIDSPIEIYEATDHNQVKLFYVPYAIESMIREAITEGQITEEDITSTPLVIKKTENSGGFAEYKNSYFARKVLEDADLDVFDELVVEQFDYTNLDLIPEPTTTEAVQEWLDKAIIEDEKSKETKADGDKAPTKTKVADRLASKLGKKTETVPEREEKSTDAPVEDDNIPEREDDSDTTGTPEEPVGDPKPTSSIRDRLSRLKK